MRARGSRRLGDVIGRAAPRIAAALATAGALVWGLSGCAGYGLRVRLEREWNCRAVELDELVPATFRATGCGHRGVYVCDDSGHCRREASP